MQRETLDVKDNARRLLQRGTQGGMEWFCSRHFSYFGSKISNPSAFATMSSFSYNMG